MTLLNKHGRSDRPSIPKEARTLIRLMSHANGASSAIAGMTVCEMSIQEGQVLKTVNKEIPDFSKQLFSRWEAALEQADYWITNLSTGPMRTRIVWLVYYLLDTDNNANSQIRLLNAEDMAAMLGTSKETISRMLSELRHFGVMKKVSPKTYSCDLNKLDRYAQG